MLHSEGTKQIDFCSSGSLYSITILRSKDLEAKIFIFLYLQQQIQEHVANSIIYFNVNIQKYGCISPTKQRNSVINEKITFHFLQDNAAFTAENKIIIVITFAFPPMCILHRHSLANTWKKNICIFRQEQKKKLSAIMHLVYYQ